MTFSYTITLEAATEADALAKMNAARVLFKNFSPVELTRLAEVVVKDPIKVKMAKKMMGL